MKTQSALSYYGSDSEVAAQLAAMLDHCSHVTIPFVGGGAIIPHLKARAIVASDKNNAAINFYRVVSGRYGKVAQACLFQQCEHTLSHPDELAKAVKFTSDPPDPVEYAWAYWAMCWLPRKGAGGTKAIPKLPSIRRNANGGANSTRIKANALDLPEWAKSFERCEWECCCFRDSLPKGKDEEENGYYVDCPWRGAGDLYLHPFVEQDHRDLREHLGRFKKATVLVRYGDDQLIRELYSDWEIIEAESRDQCNAMKGELWIINKRIKESGMLI